MARFGAETANNFPKTSPIRVIERSDLDTKNYRSLLALNIQAAKTLSLVNNIAEVQEKGSELMSQKDIEFVRAHGMRAFTENLHSEKMQELREKVFNSMGLDEKSVSGMSTERKKFIEDMISRETQKCLQETELTNSNHANDNSCYLKTRMLTETNYAFFSEQPLTHLSDFKTFLSEGAEANGSYDFFRD